ncbi:MAG: hypothetical protein ABIQ64_03745 [Candidatus Saccharimonadales bacterium]
MELIKSVARRSKLSDVVYITLNLAVAAAVLVLTVAFQPPYVAYLLVVVSKWRVFAVRPRFWWANFQTNMVDLVVGICAVTLIWQASGTFIIQLLLAVLYAAWLLIIKPRSSRKFMILQAGISQFLGLTALFSVAHFLDSSIIVALCFLIGLATARHILSSYDDEDITLLSVIWGFLLAELGWLCYHWVVAYDITTSLLLPQVAILAGLLGFVTIRFYDAKYHKKSLAKHLRAPVIFSLAVLSILLVRELSVIFNYTS